MAQFFYTIIEFARLKTLAQISQTAQFLITITKSIPLVMTFVNI